MRRIIFVVMWAFMAGVILGPQQARGENEDGATYNKRRSRMYVPPGKLKKKPVKGYKRYDGKFEGPYKLPPSPRKRPPPGSQKPKDKDVTDPPN